jgi:hypothetical protein
MSTSISPLKFIRVTENNFTEKGWTRQQVNQNNVFIENTPYVRIECVPDNSNDPRIIRGGVLLSLPTSTDPILRRVRLRKGGYSGTFLRDISMLKFSTYIIKNIDHSAPALVIQINTDDDAEREFNIVFNPRIQNSNNSSFPGVATNTWQEWDALNGMWQSEPKRPEFPGDFFSLEALLSLPRYNNARIADTPGAGHEGPGIRFTVGIGNNELIYNDFRGYVDAFTIQTPTDHKPVVYDFICRMGNENEE